METDPPLNYQLIDRESGQLLVPHLEIAARWWQRFVGWQLKAHPGAGCGLLLAPCHSIHTCFLRFPLDIVLLDQTGRVAGVRLGVRPWRATLPVPGVFAVLEVPSGTNSFKVGQRLKIVARNAAGVPKLLRALL